MIRKKRDFSISVKEICEFLNADSYLNSLEELKISDISPIDYYKENTLTFYTKNNFTKIISLIPEKQIKALIVSLDYKDKELPDSCAYIFVENVMDAVVRLLESFYPYEEVNSRICETAKIDSSAKISENVKIDSYTVIGKNVEIGKNVKIMSHVCIYPGVKIGDNSVIHSHAVIRENCVIGSNCIVQNGVVIGADGFGYIPHKEQVIVQVPQVGIVKIADNVDIGANTCIDRGAIGDTEIGQFTKIDNLVQVGHNVKIGYASFLCGQVGVAGSVDIGSQVTLGGKVGIADHISIPNKTRVAGGSIVTKKLKESGDYIGIPAMPSQVYKKQLFYFRRLEKLFKKKAD